MSSISFPRIFVWDEDPATLAAVTHLMRDTRVQSCQSIQEFLDDSRGCGAACLLIGTRQSDTWSLSDLLQSTFCPVILIADTPDVSSVVRWMRNGAFAVLDRPLDDQRLLKCLRAAMESATDEIAQRRSIREFEAKRTELSNKEMDVLELLVTGAANKRMANSLGVSVRTIESRRRTILSRLEVDSVAQLVRMETLLEVSRQKIWEDSESAAGSI